MNRYLVLLRTASGLTSFLPYRAASLTAARLAAPVRFPDSEVLDVFTAQALLTALFILEHAPAANPDPADNAARRLPDRQMRAGG